MTQVRGEGTDTNTGGFKIIYVDGVAYTPEQIGDAVAMLAKAREDRSRHFSWGAGDIQILSGDDK